MSTFCAALLRAWGWVGAVALALVLMTTSRALAAPRTAVFYGPHPPVELFAHFDRVVVDPDHVDKPPPAGTARAELFAYVAAGEVNASRAWRAAVPPGLVLLHRPEFGSDIVDTRSPGWRAFVLDRVLEPIYARGFRGFFFDTLDSYQLVAREGADATAHVSGLAAIVLEWKHRHPDVHILLNRGFEILPAVAAQVDGIVVESLFSGYDHATRRYFDVASSQSDALLNRVRDVVARYHLPVTVIDYVAPASQEARRRAARRIEAAGFDPWVSGPALDEIGVGAIEIVARKVMLLYKSQPGAFLGTHDACVLLAPVLEHFGYVVDYVDVRSALPSVSLVGQYAGIVVFVPEGVDDEGSYRRWLLRQMDAGIRVAFVEGFGFSADAEFLRRVGLAAASATVKLPVTVATTSPYVGFEVPVRARHLERPPVVAVRPDVVTGLRVRDAAGGAWDGVVLAPWGGAAFLPYVLEETLQGHRQWILDPFRFLHDALALPAIPAPDVTTESGRRILTAHIDGDAFVSRAERRGTPFTASVILDEILKRYPIPHTVSVIEGEVGPEGLYPKLSPQLEAIARNIFALPNVELASHTYSHPFEWEEAESGHWSTKAKPHLAIPGYVFDLERDIKGSIDYINSRLAPPGKTVKVLLWSGNTSPSKEAVAAATRSGVLNVNGGGATRTLDTPSLTRGSAMGIPRGDGVYQVFAPVENENVYTNDFTGPFYGFRKAIETFELTDAPRRLGILTIYYHFYSGAKTAAVVALKDVYDWASKQETIPLYLSEYAVKVLAFQRVSLARRLDGSAWEIGGRKDLATLRLDPALGWPDLARSRAIAGVREIPQGRYVHLLPGDDAVLALSSDRPSTPYLDNANGHVLAWAPSVAGAASVRFRIHGNMPLSFAVGGIAGGCTMKTARGSVAGVRSGDTVRFSLHEDDTGEATLECH